MHGRKRSTREENEAPEMQAARREKYEQYLAGCKLALSSEVAARKGEKILRFNPDFLTLWNARRRGILEEVGKAAQEESSTEQMHKEILQRELSLTKDQISERNSKSYGAWFHRRWVIENIGMIGSKVICDFAGEIALCDMLLTRDERNFHCWAHRNFVVDLANVEIKETLTKSTALIEKNFSNYSAWHLRVQALSRLGSEYAELDKDFEWVHQAVFTEPADQSAWLYFRWLLAKFRPNAAKLGEEIEVVQSLLEEEGDCKWALLALIQLYALLSIGDVDFSTEALDVCSRINAVDPTHRNFYGYLSSLFAEKNFEKLRNVLFCV